MRSGLPNEQADMECGYENNRTRNIITNAHLTKTYEHSCLILPLCPCLIDPL